MPGNASLILQQLKELQRNPLPRVGVAPTEADMNEWHCNFFFPADHNPYPSLVLHFRLSFPPDYPSASPNVTLVNTMKHSHVLGHQICFSLLPDYRGFFEATGAPRTAFWNPTRTPRSFLEDLYTFLLVDEDKHCTITPKDSAHILSQAANLNCPCGHTHNAPSPALPPPASPAPCNNSTVAPAPAAPPPQRAHGFSESSVEDLRCGITERDFFEEGVVMGFGICVKHQGRHRRQISTDLYPMCWEAYRDLKISVSPGGGEVTHFLPFAINRAHWGGGARRVFWGTVAQITRGMGMGGGDGALFVLGELWKSMAVELMSGQEHASELALKGFCAIHHLLLSLALDDQRLVHRATHRVRAFAQSPDNSTKDKVPDLGQFLPLFLLSDVTWAGPERAGVAVVKELLTRNALWITKEHPDLASTGLPPHTHTSRVELSWGPSATGLRLVSFQIRFLLALGGWVSERLALAGAPHRAPPTHPRALRAGVLGMYDACGGRPSEGMLVGFQWESKRVQAMGAYNSFFGAVGLGVPTYEKCRELLEEAMKRSEELGYHGGRQGASGRAVAKSSSDSYARFDASGRRRW